MHAPEDTNTQTQKHSHSHNESASCLPWLCRVPPGHPLLCELFASLCAGNPPSVAPYAIATVLARTRARRRSAAVHRQISISMLRNHTETDHSPAREGQRGQQGWEGSPHGLVWTGGGCVVCELLWTYAVHAAT
eukprot:scaffold1112_cov116-Isochrysis_galbana.AAC.12